jgi:hypothetical protein
MHNVRLILRTLCAQFSLGRNAMTYSLRMGGMLLMQIVGFAACTAPTSVIHVTSSRFSDWDYLLASRKSQTGHWNFELTFFEGSEASRPKHMQESFHNVDALKQALLELPKGTKINWGKYEMPGLVYPPHAVVADIERFARAHQISLVFEFVPVE